MSEIVKSSQDTKETNVKKAISFHFHPYNFNQSKHYVEKADTTGKKRKYICGISSGIKLDQHQERMTEKCVKSFLDQANNGDVLLYPDIHGIKSSEDIGILNKAEILDSGDWYTEYRLYDDDDDVDKASVEKAKKLWKQLKGEAPYKRPLQKGFSIEGYIPDTGILSHEKDEKGNIGRRVIDEVQLEGVVLVPRPAYKDSIATAVYKALGELHPIKIEKIQKNIQSKIQEKINTKNIKNKYFDKRYEIQSALEEAIEEVMTNENEVNKQQQLEVLFQEFARLMIDLIMQSQEWFDEEVLSKEDNPYSNEIKQATKEVIKPSNIEVYKTLLKIAEKNVKSKNKQYSQGELFEVFRTISKQKNKQEV